MDLDHVPDYVILAKERFSLDRFFSWYRERRWKKLWIPFHSYELILILLVIAYWLGSDVMTGIAMGSAIHLMTDQIGNAKIEWGERLSPWFYFFSYRCRVGFEKKKLLVTVR